MAQPQARLSLAYRNLDTLTYPVIRKFTKTTKELDLSYNRLSEISLVSAFEHLTALVLDGNRITSHTNFPTMPHLNTLCVNRNAITNLALFIDKIKVACPNIQYLSMLNNEACPNYFNGGTPKQYHDYRMYVIAHLPTLNMLDSTPISEEEQAEARQAYGSLARATAPPASPSVPQYFPNPYSPNDK
eukprot:gnl/Trimastix_PCT/4075.p1 GENE.gnl/Trimastix_PCT/4075~~gnl/Trimastix_PCT/4075.p1  ORF type:complete len:195 (+),score=33.41 gnl/Trimastix_PCT/4075:26-586(+)